MATRKDLLDYLAKPQVKAARYRLFSSTFDGKRGSWEQTFGWRNFRNHNAIINANCMGMSRLWIRYMRAQKWALSAVPSGGIKRLWNASLTITAQARALSASQSPSGVMPGDPAKWVDDRCGGGSTREEFAAILSIGGHAMAIYGRDSYVYFYDSNFVAYTYDRSLFTLKDHVQSYVDTVYRDDHATLRVTSVFNEATFGWP